MPLKIPWPHPEGHSQQGVRDHLWRWGSNFAIFTIGGLSKVWMQGLNTTFIYNENTLLKLVEQREEGRPLLTVCNHTSTADDPLLFGLLPWRILARGRLMRWGLGAHNVCFTKESHGTFFALGKIIPVIRGDGVYQKGMDTLLAKMDVGDWAHVFPEGKVNLTQEWMRLKWGVGRLIAEARIPPLVLPFWHEGINDVLPVGKPYIPRIGKKVTVVIGEVIDTREILERLKADHPTAEGLRKALTDYVQSQLKICRDAARKIHFGAAEGNNNDKIREEDTPKLKDFTAKGTET